MIKVEGKQITIDRFPNGELLVKTDFINKLSMERIKVEFKWVNNEDILSLYFILNHIIKRDISKYIDLYIYYLPFSRMDRSQNGSCFTLDYIITLISNALSKGSKVFIVEPHSDVSIKLFAANDIKAERINFISPLMEQILKNNKQIDIICYPDKGARDRFKDDSLDKPVIYCEKVRDFDTGQIKGLELVGEIKEGQNVLILDDLCSKGGTFYHTAKKLKDNGANNIYLGVCHMEQTVKYGQILQEYKNWDEVDISLINHIYCSNSMNYGTEFTGYTNITIYDIEKFIEKGIIEEYIDEYDF